MPTNVVVIGPGPRFLSGIGYHTAAIIRSLAARSGITVTALLVRRLCPERFYPGRARIGQFDLSCYELPNHVEVAERLDWYWGMGIMRALAALRRSRPEVALFQWWTVTTAHTYLLLAWFAKRQGARVVIELHEVTDVGEAALPFLSGYGRLIMRILSRWLDGVVVHSSDDERTMAQAFPWLKHLPVQVIYPGPLHDDAELRSERSTHPATGPVRFLYFGVLRSYKGLDELSEAFSRLVDSGEDVHLAVVGEAWEDEVSGALDSLRRLGSDRCTIDRRFVADDEVPELFRNADVLVAPYRRASASGPVNLCMAAGIPLVTTRVPALVEACSQYEGVELADVEDPDSLLSAMQHSLRKVGRQYENPQSWANNADRYDTFFGGLLKS